MSEECAAMNPQSVPQPPGRTIDDHTHAAVCAIASAVPWIGGGIVEFVNAVWAPPVQRRQQEWMRQITEIIRQLLADRSHTVESLRDNETLTSVFLQATLIAQRTHHREKLECLQNAVYSAAIGRPNLTDDKMLIFVRYIDELAPFHMHILGFLQKHDADVRKIGELEALRDYFIAHGGALQDRELFKLALTDLCSRLLVRMTSMMSDYTDIAGARLVAMTKLGGTLPRLFVTQFGREFLLFVSATDDLNNIAAYASDSGSSPSA